MGETDLSEYLSGGYLSGKDIADNGGSGVCIAEIIESAKMEQKQFADRSDERVTTAVRFANGREKDWTLNRTTVRKLSAVWGTDGNAWVGHKVKLFVSRQLVRGEMRDVIIGEPA